MPPGLSFEQAAAIPLAGMTACDGLFLRAHLALGQTVLITSANGGVGSLALQLAKAAGASYVARGTVYHVQQLDKLIVGGLQKKGFALVEAFSNCHTYFGRLNKEGDAVAMLNWMKEHAMPIKAAKALPPEKLVGKFLTGVLWDVEMPEYCDQYQKLIDSFNKKEE